MMFFSCKIVTCFKMHLVNGLEFATALNAAGRSGEVLRAPHAESGAEPQPKRYFRAFWNPRNHIWWQRILCFCCAKSTIFWALRPEGPRIAGFAGSVVTPLRKASMRRTVSSLWRAPNACVHALQSDILWKCVSYINNSKISALRERASRLKYRAAPAVA